MNNNKPLILICGPTGVGKSDLAVKLAKDIGGEIISADSVQVYKGLDIGSAKIKKEEMSGINHYLIDCLKPDMDFGVHIFQQMAKDAIDEIYSHNNIPIIVGGTAFYIQALIYDIDFTEEDESDHSYRDELYNGVSNEADAKALWNKLNEIDENYAAQVHYNNVKRVARALEYNHNTGRLFSDYNKEQANRSSDYNFLYIGLVDNRELLYERINKRVDIMLQNGLIDEVKGLLEAGYDNSCNSMNSIGYKEICDYLAGNLNLEDAIYKIKQNSRHYAKRQLTWLRRERDVSFINRSDYKNDDEILDKIKTVLYDKNIINKED